MHGGKMRMLLRCLNDGCRSTSVGDQVLVGKTKYECSPYGWEIVT